MSASDHELNRALRALAQAAPESAPPALEDRLIEAFRTHRRTRVRQKLLAAAMGAVAAALLLFAVIRAPIVPKITPPDAADSDLSSFSALPDVDPMGPWESGAVVRVQLNLNPRAMDDGSADMVQADVLLGEDGRAHAVRFLP